MSHLLDRFYEFLFSVYCRFKGYKIGWSPEQQEASGQQLLKQIFAQSGFYDSPEEAIPLPDGGGTTRIATVHCRGELVGAMEITASAQTFASEYFFNLEIPESISRNEIVEIERLGILPAYRGRKHAVSYALFFHFVEVLSQTTIELLADLHARVATARIPHFFSQGRRTSVRADR